LILKRRKTKKRTSEASETIESKSKQPKRPISSHWVFLRKLIILRCPQLLRWFLLGSRRFSHRRRQIITHNDLCRAFQRHKTASERQASPHIGESQCLKISHPFLRVLARNNSALVKNTKKSLWRRLSRNRCITNAC